MGGALFGEMRYQARLAAQGRIGSPRIRAFVLALLDPLGELERFLLGLN